MATKNVPVVKTMEIKKISPISSVGEVKDTGSPLLRISAITDAGKIYVGMHMEEKNLLVNVADVATIEYKNASIADVLSKMGVEDVTVAPWSTFIMEAEEYIKNTTKKKVGDTVTPKGTEEK